jgi:GntR family transcriptional repressor for pyruvate dehydrogenase complex
MSARPAPKIGSVAAPSIAFTPVRTRRTFEEAVQQIGDAIRAGYFAEGERLPSERTLASAMQISRRTLREATRVLVEAGVVEVRSGGMVVRSETVPIGAIEQRSQLRVGQVAQVLEARRLLEPRVAQLAALYATDDDFAALERTIELQRKIGDDRERLSALDTRFHLVLAHATRNYMVVAQMRLLLRDVEIARDMALRGPFEAEAIVETHARTLAAIESGDGQRIEQAMDAHLSYLERLWEAESGRPRLRRPPAFLVPGEAGGGSAA